MLEDLTAVQIMWLLAATAAIAFYLGRMATPRSHEEQRRYEQMASEAAAGDFARLAPSQRTEVDDLIAAGRIVDAIKLVRAALGVGLYEAKQIVDLRKSLSHAPGTPR